jgi:O-antigen/teichoic acid export membrane protein
MFLTMAEVFAQLSSLTVFILFLNFDVIIFITYLTICEISVTSALQFSSSDPHSYISIFSEINYQKDPIAYKENFYKLNKLLMLFVCIIVGIMFFFIEIYITVIYSQRYLIILIYIQIILFSAFSKIVVRNLFIITQSIGKTQINAKIAFYQMIINILSAFCALLFFGFLTIIIFLLLGSFLLTYLAVRLINKSIDLKLKAFVFYKPFLVFIISFIIVFPFYYFINFQFIPQIYLLNVFFNNLIKFITFAFVFYIILYRSRLITKQEFNQLIEIIPILNSNKNIIKKIVFFIEKLLPSEKKK